MKAWAIEADRIQIDDNWNDIAFVVNKKIDDFTASDSKFFVVAPKGLGKTLVIKNKSKVFRDKNKANYYYPQDNLCERLGKPAESASFGFDELSRYSSREHWKDIWEVIFMTLICQTVALKLPDDLTMLIGEANSATDILSIILEDRKNFGKYTNIVSKFLRPEVSKIGSTLCMFFDNIDQALDVHIGYSLVKRRGVALSEEVWVNAQLGFMDASISIHDANRRVKVFGAIRIEAVRKSLSSLTMQLNDYCSILGYRKDELLLIFQRNIDFMNRNELTSPGASDPIERFLGIRTIDHPIIMKKGKKQVEDLFDYIYRHTYGRPREIVLMGYRLASIDPPTSRTAIKISETINGVSAELLDQYKREVIPFFDEEEYAIFLKVIRSNVLTKKQMLFASSTAQCLVSDTDHIFCSYYKKGLVGVCKLRHDQQLEQHFLPVAEHMFEEDGCLPASKYYLMHPTLENDLKHRHVDFRYDNDNIIGHGYLFHPRQSHGKKWVHVHFGAGRLGLGLVVPALGDSCKLIIISRPNEKWSQLRDGTFELRLNGKVTLHITKARRNLSMLALEKLLSGPDHVLLCTSNEKMIRSALFFANSISTALGPGLSECVKIISKSELSRRVNMYPFENDKQFVERMCAQFNLEAAAIDIVPVVADRVCVEVKVSQQNVNVLCDKYSEITIQDVNQEVQVLWGNLPGNINLSHTVEEQDFFYLRKFWLVNGIHMIMAIQAYSSLMRGKVPRTEWPAYRLNIFADIESVRKHVDTLSKVQIIRLMLNTDKETLEICYPGIGNAEIYKKLLTYAREMQKRMAAFPDFIGRVLSLNGFAALKPKYEQRIRQLADYLESNERQVRVFAKSIGAKGFSTQKSYREIARLFRSISDILMGEDA